MAKDYKKIAQKMRDAIDAMEGVLVDTPIMRLAEAFSGADPSVLVRVQMSVDTLMRLNRALMEHNRIINSDEFTIAREG